MTYPEQYAPGLPYEAHAPKAPERTAVSSAAKRAIFRWIHIVFSIPIFGYIYSPFDQIPNYAPATRFFFVPVLVLSGLWMWKGHAVRRLLWKRLA